MNTLKFNKQNTKTIAHRGLSGLETENTCAAFVAAGNRESYYGIECDVHRTLDGEFLVFHDDDTARVGIDNLVLEESTFDTLRHLQLKDVDGKRGRIDLTMPTLLEYIQICKKYEKKAILELKNEFVEQDILRIIEMIQGADYLAETVFISFALNNLITLRKLLPTQPAQYLLCEWSDEALATMQQYQLDLDIYYKAVTPEVVAAVHAAGFVINCWTVNEIADGDALAAMGVDYITTNILE